MENLQGDCWNGSRWEGKFLGCVRRKSGDIVGMCEVGRRGRFLECTGSGGDFGESVI